MRGRRTRPRSKKNQSPAHRELLCEIRLGQIVFILNRWLKEFVQKPCRFIRDANDLVGRLTVQLEIEFGLPVGRRSNWRNV